MKKILRCGVIGSGFMGGLHCKAYSGIAEAEFTGIYDADHARAEQAAEKFGSKAFDDLEVLLSSVDAASIAAPTVLHREIALQCLKKGVCLLVEKPLAATLEEGKEIASEATGKGLTVAVGYIERFNPAVMELIKRVVGRKIVSIEAERLAPPAPRANDVSVVFDLMIHDIDILLALSKSGARVKSAEGKKIGSEVLNSVSCELVSDSGIPLKLSSNKVADRKSRVIKVTFDDGFVAADLISKKIRIITNGKEDQIEASGGEPIKEEVLDFVRAVQSKSKPRVSAEDSLRSLALAEEIERAIGSK